MSLKNDIRLITEGTDAKGMEKAVLIVLSVAGNIKKSLVTIFEGKPISKDKKHKNPLDYGIVPITKQVAEIDLCNILTYAVSKTPNLVKNIPIGADKKNGSSSSADSTKKEAREKTKFEKTLQFIQDKSYDGQVLIDKFYSNFGDIRNANSLGALFILTQDLQTTLNPIFESANDINSEVSKAFPQVSGYQSFIDNVFGYFNKFSDFGQLPKKDIDKIFSYIDKIRGVLVAIQCLDPKNLGSGVLNALLLSPDVQEQLDRLNKIVKPERLLPFIKNIQQVCVNIQTQANSIISIVRRGQSLISTLVLIVKILQLVIKFIKALLAALPSMFTTAGIIITFKESLDKIKNYLDDIIKRLNQLNEILQIVVYIISYVVSQIEETISYLKIIILNLENCNYADPDIVKDLKNTVASLEDTVKVLKDFKNNYENKKSSTNNTFGDVKNKYTIRIITEQLADDNIDIKRRYGIALDRNGILVASSTPTFASEDSIIIDEVKLILVSKKLVNPEISELSSESISTINEALNFLEDDELSVQNFIDNIGIEFSSEDEDIDSPTNEDEEKGIGMNAFLNKLSGGKKLRQRVRKKMSTVSTNYQTKTASINSPIAQKVANSQSTYSKNLKIEELQEQRAELVNQRSKALLLGPAGAAVVAAKTKEIKDIDAQITELRK